MRPKSLQKQGQLLAYRSLSGPSGPSVLRGLLGLSPRLQSVHKSFLRVPPECEEGVQDTLGRYFAICFGHFGTQGQRAPKNTSVDTPLDTPIIYGVFWGTPGQEGAERLLCAWVTMSQILLDNAVAKVAPWITLNVLNMPESWSNICGCAIWCWKKIYSFIIEGYVRQSSLLENRKRYYRVKIMSLFFAITQVDVAWFWASCSYESKPRSKTRIEAKIKNPLQDTSENKITLWPERLHTWFSLFGINFIPLNCVRECSGVDDLNLHCVYSLAIQKWYEKEGVWIYIPKKASYHWRKRQFSELLWEP